MIQHIWLIIIIIYSFCQAQSKDTKEAVLWCNTTPEIGTSNVCAGLRVPSHTQLSSIQTRLQKARSDFITTAKLWAHQAHHKTLIEKACMYASLAEVTDFFEQCRAQGTFSDTELVTWYALYQSSSYRKYVKGLPGYEHQVIQLHRQFCKDKKVRKKAAKKMGLTLESAQKLVDHLWKDLQHDRATQEARNCMQKEQWQKQEQLTTLKNTQQRMVQSQTNTLERCITQWKTRAQESNDFSSTRYIRRLNSANSDHWHERSYHLNTSVTTLLAQHNISPDSFAKVYGNGLQHTLHSEFVSMLEQVACNTQYTDSDIFLQKLNRCALECTDIGCAYNTEGAVASASLIADIGWNILDLTSAVAKAIRDATINTVDLIMHPLETLCAINHSVFYFVATTGDGLLYQDTDYQYVPENKDAVIAAYDTIGRHLLDTASQMKGRDWVKSTVCFATECVLQAKLLKTLVSVCKGAGNYALRCAQVIESSLPEAKAAVTGIEGITTEIKLGETIAHVAQQEERLFNLIKQVDGTYRSPAGLIYGEDPKFGNRIYHVLEHMKEIPNKRYHTLFNTTEDKLFGLLDEAWLKKGPQLANDLGTYVIDMGKVIGTQGETAIRIVTKQSTSQILTAYPVKI